MKPKKNKYYDKLVKTGEIPLTDSKKDTIYKWLYDCNLVEWYVTYLMKKSMKDDDVKDTVQEMWLQIFNVKQEMWDDLFEQGYYAVSSYVTGIIHRQIKSGNSAYYLKYGRYNKTEYTKDDLFWQNIDENYEEIEY